MLEYEMRQRPHINILLFVRACNRTRSNFMLYILMLISAKVNIKTERLRRTKGFSTVFFLFISTSHIYIIYTICPHIRQGYTEQSGIYYI